MHHKGHDARCKYVVLHVRIPRRPHPLTIIEVDIVMRDLFELAPVGVWRLREQSCRHRRIPVYTSGPKGFRECGLSFFPADAPASHTFVRMDVRL
jgi:hypothetical protein